MNNLQKLQQHVVELASHVDQLHEVIFTDLDGVPILRCSIDSSAEMSIKTHFLASKALSAEKVRTLTIGDLKSAVFYYSQYQCSLILFLALLMLINTCYCSGPVYFFLLDNNSQAQVDCTINPRRLYPLDDTMSVGSILSGLSIIKTDENYLEGEC
ncbi:Ragulator complex protein LAMTOR3, partial [Trichinella pseudospiralis]